MSFSVEKNPQHNSHTVTSSHAKFSLNHNTSSASSHQSESSIGTSNSRSQRYNADIFGRNSRDILEDDESFRSSLHSVLSNDDSHGTLDSAINVPPHHDFPPSFMDDDGDDNKNNNNNNDGKEIEMTNLQSSTSNNTLQGPSSTTVKFTRDSILHNGKKISIQHSHSMHHTTRSRIFSINSRRYNLKEELVYDIKHFVIMPGKFNKARQLFVELLCFIIAIFVPFFLSFDSEEVNMFSNQSWVTSSWVISVLFMIDFLLEFVTAIKDEIGHLVVDRSEIARMYFQSGWLAIDFIAMIPIVAFTDTSEKHDREDMSWTSFRTLTSFALLFKLTKVIKYETNFATDVIQQQHHSKWFRVCKLLIYTLLILHNFACFWHFLGQRSHEGDTWLDDGKIIDEPIKRRYVASVYFVITTLTSVGYGDYNAQTQSEEVYNVFIMVIGCVGYAFCIGSASSFVSNFNVERKHRTKILKDLEAFMAESKLPKELKIKCRTATHLAHQQNTNLHRSKQTLETLPNSLQTEITLFIHRKLINDIRFLRENLDDHPHFVRHAAALMQIPFSVKQGEMIIQENTLPEDLYFIVSGSVIVVKDGLPVMELHNDDFFGEISILLGSKREASVYALTDCVCYTMSADSLKLLNRRFPSVINQMKSIAKTRREQGSEVRARKKTIVDAVMLQRQGRFLSDVIIEGVNESFSSSVDDLQELDDDSEKTNKKDDASEHQATNDSNVDASSSLLRVEKRLRRIEETLSILLYKSKTQDHRGSRLSERVLDYATEK